MCSIIYIQYLLVIWDGNLRHYNGHLFIHRACFGSGGIVPVLRDSLKIMLRHRAREFASCLIIAGDMLSRPRASGGLRLCIS